MHSVLHKQTEGGGEAGRNVLVREFQAIHLAGGLKSSFRVLRVQRQHIRHSFVNNVNATKSHVRRTFLSWRRWPSTALALPHDLDAKLCKAGRGQFPNIEPTLVGLRHQPMVFRVARVQREQLPTLLHRYCVSLRRLLLCGCNNLRRAQARNARRSTFIRGLW